MIIRLTQKLAKKLKVTPIALPRAPGPLADWTANLFNVGRTQYILLTNSASLYATVLPGRGLNSPQAFTDRAIATLLDQLSVEGYAGIIEQLIAHTAEIVFAKTDDRSLLGSMNDQVRCAMSYLERVGDTTSNATSKLNAMPMGALDYRFPQEALEGLVGLRPAVPQKQKTVVEQPTFSEFETKRFTKLVEDYIESRRPPLEIRDQIDLGFRIAGRSVEIREIRTAFDNPQQKIEEAVAKATYVASRQCWKLYWKRADLRWHRYEPQSEVKRLEDFLKIVERDEFGCFFG